MTGSDQSTALLKSAEDRKIVSSNRIYGVPNDSHFENHMHNGCFHWRTEHGRRTRSRQIEAKVACGDASFVIYVQRNLCAVDRSRIVGLYQTPVTTLRYGQCSTRIPRSRIARSRRDGTGYPYSLLSLTNLEKADVTMSLK